MADKSRKSDSDKSRLTSPVLTAPQINDTSGDHQYVVAVSELAADRTVTLPLLTGPDEFVFKDHAATLTNKSIAASQLTGDVAVARLGNGTFTVITSTDTGTQNNWAPAGISGNTLILCNGSSDITITGITAGTDGEMLLIVPKNSAQKVILAHESASSTVANRLQNVATSGNTTIAAPNASRGHALYIYEDARWRLKSFEQGDWITPAFVAGDYTGSGSMTWTVESGDVTHSRYLLRGRTLFWNTNINTTTVGNTLNTELRITIPGGLTAASQTIMAVRINDNGTEAISFAYTNSDTLLRWRVNATDPAVNWTASTNATGVQGQFVFEVT